MCCALVGTPEEGWSTFVSSSKSGAVQQSVEPDERRVVARFASIPRAAS